MRERERERRCACAECVWICIEWKGEERGRTGRERGRGRGSVEEVRGKWRMAGGSHEDEPIATKEMCAFCFDVLQHHFVSSTMKAPVERFEDAHCPLFVTWNIRSKSMMESLFGSEETTAANGGSKSGGSQKVGRLRGCIGTLEATRLRTGLREYALISSLRDRR